ncbi:hypothetical protein NUW54_g12869 [Trametes sanguinea]|uniref:Uncharacterized protein n=1 Tax=Trametes sanguinea TaxID=158606 RepID=A0ACC1MU20_9APHY|nr:hypothetical protein NUW54_g12869 [Trametes sanguinea]
MRERREAEEDAALVSAEFTKYAADMLEDKRVDLLRFWQMHKTVYPLLYRVALDILPIPASSVPCERVFSSSKETDALRRSGLGTAMMEILQILKFSRKQALRDRLVDATLVSNEKTLLRVFTVDPEEASKLLQPDHIRTFVHLLHEFNGDSP